MKRYIKSNSQNGYLYIFKHGIGPGTLPSDVTIIRTKDLPNGYTAVWTERFLTTEEMDQYDIPHETEINRYLDRIGYCQKDGDVVPCDKVTASVDMSFSKKAKQYAQAAWNKGMSVDKACDFVFNAMTKDGYYTESESVPATIQKAVELVYEEEGDPNDPSTWVGACDKVTASIKSHPPIPEGWERVPEGDDDDGNWGTICKELPNNSGYIWIDMFYNEKNRRYYELQIGYRKKDGSIGDIWKISREPIYSLSNALAFADRYISNDSEDVEACGNITAADEVDKDFDVFMLMDYQADTGPDTMGMAGDRFSCLGKFYASSLEEAGNELKQIKDKVKSENPDFYYAAYSGLHIIAYDETLDDFEEDPYYGMPVVYPNLSDLLDAVIYPDYSDDNELPFDPTAEPDTKTFDNDSLDNILTEFTETVSFDPDYNIAGISYDIKDDLVKFVIIFNNGETIDNWIESISELPLDGDRYTTINYLTSKFDNMLEGQ